MGVTVTGTAEATCAVDFSGDNEAESFGSPFYRNNQTCSPHAEGVATIENGRFRGVVDLYTGANARHPQPVGLQSEAPIALIQGYGEYGGDFYFGLGRRVTWMGVEVIADQDFTLRDPNFGLIPYIEDGLWVGLRRPTVHLRAGVLPAGPDRFQDNNDSPYLVTNITWTPTSNFSLFVNYQAGPDQDDNDDNWRHLADLGVSFDPTPELSLKAYALIGREETEGEANDWRGANLYLGLRPTGSRWKFLLRAGMTHDDGQRTGVEDLTLGSFTAGTNVSLTDDDTVQLRVQGQMLFATGDQEPFAGEATRTRLTTQLVVNF